ncbi:hypothetical protein SO802_006203 [Lithocarpus litseifolius]|uniref:Uncharacterized protein n=1 Tax=Lithocarpus litseifolius TaxID=425828 RepID=A0AAW2DPF8_9ROSI
MAENRDKGKAPIQDYSQIRRFTEQPYEMHEGASSSQEAVSLQEYATVAHSSGNTVITLQETPTPIYSSGNLVVDVLNYTLEENLAKDSYGINSNFPYPTKIILDILQSAFILDNDHLFQRTLKTLKNHLDNLEARNDPVTSLLSGKEKICSKDKTVLMGTCFARLSLKTQASVRSAFANLPSEIQVRILGSKVMSESIDLWFRHFRVLITTRYYDPDDPDLDYTTNLNYTAENAFTVSRWEACFGSSLRVYEREKHPFPGLLINYNDLLEDEEEDNQMNPHWLSQMFEYGFVRLIRLTSHNQVSQLPAIIRDTVTRVSSPYVTIRCWSTLPEWEMNHWATVQPSKHLVLIGGYSHQGPWFEVFTGRPYYESIPLLPWTTNCDPRKFLTPGQNPDFEPLIYCSLCEKFTTFHEHACNNDPPWEPQEKDNSWFIDLEWYICPEGFIDPKECINPEEYIWFNGYIDPKGSFLSDKYIDLEGHICPDKCINPKGAEYGVWCHTPFVTDDAFGVQILFWLGWVVPEVQALGQAKVMVQAPVLTKEEALVTSIAKAIEVARVMAKARNGRE